MLMPMAAVLVGLSERSHKSIVRCSPTGFGVQRKNLCFVLSFDNDVLPILLKMDTPVITD